LDGGVLYRQFLVYFNSKFVVSKVFDFSLARGRLFILILVQVGFLHLVLRSGFEMDIAPDLHLAIGSNLHRAHAFIFHLESHSTDIYLAIGSDFHLAVAFIFHLEAYSPNLHLAVATNFLLAHVSSNDLSTEAVNLDLSAIAV
jgi:hypothetical protein